MAAASAESRDSSHAEPGFYCKYPPNGGLSSRGLVRTLLVLQCYPDRRPPPSKVGPVLFILAWGRPEIFSIAQGPIGV